MPPLGPLGTVVGVLAAAIVLFVAFGSLLAALLPLITALAGAGAGLMAIAPLTHSNERLVVIAPTLGGLVARRRHRLRAVHRDPVPAGSDGRG